jgi:hypothetical protein
MNSPFSSANPFAFKSDDVSPFNTLKEPAPLAHVPSRQPLDLSTDEVMVEVCWGADVQSVHRVSPPKPFLLGTKGGVRVPSELGVEGHALVSWMGQVPMLQVPQGATLSASSGAQGQSLELQAGVEYTISVGTLSFRVFGVAKEAKVGTGFLARASEAAHKQIGASFLLHAGIIGSLAFFMPAMGADDAEASERDQVLMMQKLLTASADRELEQKQTTSDGPQAESGGEAAEKAKGAEGKVGSTTAKAANARWAKEGPKDNPNPQLSRAMERSAAETFGFIGTLNAGAFRDNAPTSPWGVDAALGRDNQSANGNMFGDTIGDALGGGALGMQGTEEGGGGNGLGIGIAEHGGLMGNGLGNCTGPDCKGGWGKGGSARVGGNHIAKGPSARAGGPPEVNGRIPKEVIQRIVRQNFGRFTACYQTGLRSNPSLTGRVAVRFTIDRNGAVGLTQDGGSDLPDQAVRSCVVRSFAGLSFPAPEGGMVTVTYPIMFTPGE